ncbi:coiled-coil domain-containing protein 134 isoform X1 [Molothrus ater]|uniref:coiled-coil domain-containing protein 134 isoform X1 n=1 Tax=Molothrus ater TaxID=84834 RepID=UPI00174D7EC4|nr:coiled-coil domain-containing protein 134 isoform X1 [Molothrus ater]
MSGAGSAAPGHLSGPWVKGLCPTGSACHRRLLAPRWSHGRSGAPRLPGAAVPPEGSRPPGCRLLRPLDTAPGGFPAARPGQVRLVPFPPSPCDCLYFSRACGRIRISCASGRPSPSGCCLNPSGTRVGWNGPIPAGNHSRKSGLPNRAAAVANMDFLIICPFLLALLLSQGSFTDLEKQRVDSGLEIYKKLFEVKRKDQMNALKNLIELNDVNQQYKIIDIMLKGLFKVLEDSRAVLIAADVPPDGPFPQDEKIKDAYSHVVENTAFFGDVVLRFPKIVHHYFDRNSNWNSLIRWGIGFCNLTGVFEQGPHSQVLRLMAQELGISEKSPDYRNPFKTDQSEFFPSADTFQKALRDEEKRRKKEEKRKEIRKGPRISRSQSEL